MNKILTIRIPLEHGWDWLGAHLAASTILTEAATEDEMLISAGDGQLIRGADQRVIGAWEIQRGGNV